MRHALVLILGSVLLFMLLAIRPGTSLTDMGDDTITIEFWTHTGGTGPGRAARFWQSAADEFMQANPGIRVRVVANLDQNLYPQLVGVRSMARRMPDALLMDDWTIPPLIDAGLVEPLDAFVAHSTKVNLQDFPPSMVADGIRNGQRWSVPWHGGFSCLYYRTDLFAEAGIAAPPETWDEVIAVAAQFQQRGMPYPLAFEPTAGFWFLPLIWQNGGTALTDDFRRVRLLEPAVVDAVTQLHDWLYTYRIVDPAYASGRDVKAAWSSGAVAMMVHGSWTLGSLDTDYPYLKGKWDVALLPTGKRDTGFYGGQHLLVASSSRHAEAAWKFIEFALEVPRQREWTDITLLPPVNLGVYETADFEQNHPHLARLRGAAARGQNIQMAPFFAELYYERFCKQVLQRFMPDANADIPAVMKEVQPRLQQLVDDFWKTQPDAPSTGEAP